MQYPALVTTVFFATACYASTIGKAAKYEPEQLDNVSLFAASLGYVLTYRTPLESLYFSPGVKLIHKVDNTYIEVVRCRIDQECVVDFKSTYADDGSYQVRIDSDAPKDNVHLGMPTLPY